MEIARIEKPENLLALKMGQKAIWKINSFSDPCDVERVFGGFFVSHQVNDSYGTRIRSFFIPYTEIEKELERKI